MRLELTHRNRHYPLKVACIPISPLAHNYNHEGKKRAQNRTRTCTALRPLVPETSVSTNFTIWANGYLLFREKKRNPLVSLSVSKSEKRDSNPRPRPWQGRALLPPWAGSYFRNAVQRYCLFDNLQIFHRKK